MVPNFTGANAYSSYNVSLLTYILLFLFLYVHFEELINLILWCFLIMFITILKKRFLYSLFVKIFTSTNTNTSHIGKNVNTDYQPDYEPDQKE